MSTSLAPGPGGNPDHDGLPRRSPAGQRRPDQSLLNFTFEGPQTQEGVGQVNFKRIVEVLTAG